MDTRALCGFIVFLCAVFVPTSDTKKTISDHVGFKDFLREQQILSDHTCTVKYKNVGCYNDKVSPKKRALGELLFQDREKGKKTYGGQMIDWKNWATYLPELICRCAVAASDKGYIFFGIQFYGECWSGSDAPDHIFMYGANTDCINTEFGPCEEASEEPCSGVKHRNFVYEIVPAFPETGSGVVGPGLGPEEY